MTTLTVGDFCFELRHSNKRRTIGIDIDRDGKLIISCRPDVPTERLEEVIHNKRWWIHEKLLQKESFSPPPPIKTFVSGEGFYYLGRSYRLKLIDDSATDLPLRLYQSRFLLQRSHHTQGRDLFIQWYRHQLQDLLALLVPQLAQRIAVEPSSAQVRELGYRWGSCSAQGNLYFHWRLAMLPKPMIEYIVAHELIHLIELDHGSKFWDRVERITPDFEQRKQWLAEHGAEYDL